VQVQYDGEGTDPALLAACGIARTNQGKTCTVPVRIAEDMAPPVRVYYELDNFFQSHRRYVLSVDSTQLLGSVLSA
jgi:LEM3 (ligand-effect modulator 3) family / CDC50 family